MFRSLAQVNGPARRKFAAQQLVEIKREGTFGPITDLDGRPRDPDKYVRIGEKLFEHFTRQPKAMGFANRGVKHGFRVCGRMAMRGVDAYAASIENGARAEGSTEELAEILGRSYTSAVLPFANEPSKACTMMETAFGLLGNRYSTEPDSFVINGEEGEEKLAPSESLLSDIEATVDREREGADPGAGCPARGIVLQAIWSATVETCATNEHLFPADIERINAGVYLVIQ